MALIPDMAYKAGGPYTNISEFRSAAVLLHFELIIVDCVVAAVGTIPVYASKDYNLCIQT